MTSSASDSGMVIRWDRNPATVAPQTMMMTYGTTTMNMTTTTTMMMKTCTQTPKLQPDHRGKPFGGFIFIFNNRFSPPL
jgi:hypothetical protein